jgi:exonuclease SbcD
MPLRLVHTSDWHLGHQLHGVDREPEHRAFLAWLAQLLEAEQADALLVTGDVFDASNPPAAASALFYGFLAQVWSRLPRLQVVVIGGNHDSASRLEASDPLLRALGRLHVVGALPREGHAVRAERALVHVASADGSEAAWIAAVPFLRAADVRPDEAGDDATSEGVRRIYREVIHAAEARRSQGEAIVATGHLYLLDGLASSRSERPLFGGNLRAVPADVFAPSVTYAALGHLHRPQSLDGGRIRYAGSVLPLAFDEVDYPHQVVIVEIAGGALRGARPVRIPRFRELVRLPATGPLPLDKVLPLLRALPARGDLPDEELPLLEVQVALPRPEPSLRLDLDQALRGKAARLVRFTVTYTGSGAALAEAARGQLLDDLLPEDVFLSCWKRKHGEPPGADLAEAFRELVAQAEAEEAP